MNKLKSLRQLLGDFNNMFQVNNHILHNNIQLKLTNTKIQKIRHGKWVEIKGFQEDRICTL